MSNVSVFILARNGAEVKSAKPLNRKIKYRCCLLVGLNRFGCHNHRLAERESNRIARRRCIFASSGELWLARLVSCFAKSHQNLSKMHSPAGASSFDAADFSKPNSFSRRIYRRYFQEKRCRDGENLHVKTNLVRFPFGYRSCCHRRIVVTCRSIHSRLRRSCGNSKSRFESKQKGTLLGAYFVVLTCALSRRIVVTCRSISKL